VNHAAGEEENVMGKAADRARDQVANPQDRYGKIWGRKRRHGTCRTTM